MQSWRRKIELTRQQKPIVHQIPNLPNDRLIGRDDILARLETYLSLKTVVQRGSLTIFKETGSEVFQILNSEEEIDRKKNTRIFVLWGGIGTGKTRLALEYAYKVGGGLPTPRSASENGMSSPSSSIHADKIDPPYSYIVWVDAKTKESAKSAFLDFAESLNLELGFQTPGVQLIIDYLNSCGLPWLLIFDDVVDVEAIEGCWSRSSKGSIIITTRDPEFCLYLSWKASSDGAMQGQINMKRQPCFPESWFYQEVPGLVRDSAIQLFKSLSFSGSDLTTGIQEAKLIVAIGSSPSLIYAAAEAVNLGLISIVDICGQGYVDFEILAAAENYFQTRKRESTDSITPKLRYREIISQWDDEISRMTAQLTDTSILHLVICFTSSPLEDEISSWIAARLQSKGVDERVTEVSIVDGTQSKEMSNRGADMASFFGSKLTSSLRGARRLLGGSPRSSSNFYQFGGTFRRYLAKKITCIEGKSPLDLSLTFASDVVSLNSSHNSYRSGYAHITLGMIQIGQKELEAVEKSIESAILCFAQCRKVDYILYYAATANALLGWVQADLHKHNDAIHYLETAHKNYSSHCWDSISLFRDGYSEVKKRLCRLEYMLSLSYDQLENKQKRIYWRERTEFPRESLAPQGSEAMTEKESYESLTDFGVSDLFSIEEL
ncbi:hypothetical protein TWF225_002842 [Orbilia oligospora]|nr:hypothetical protein TWF225_002842 [Orbilia oligospora]KAF3249415.1 hypothetical protein TWF128_007842 [Orbilia oligospora]KAF3263792.1 hypothetical protein TWF217_003501 [Orbilia oligospora]